MIMSIIKRNKEHETRDLTQPRSLGLSSSCPQGAGRRETLGKRLDLTLPITSMRIPAFKVFLSYNTLQCSLGAIHQHELDSIPLAKRKQFDCKVQGMVGGYHTNGHNDA